MEKNIGIKKHAGRVKKSFISFFYFHLISNYKKLWNGKTRWIWLLLEKVKFFKWIIIVDIFYCPSRYFKFNDDTYALSPWTRWLNSNLKNFRYEFQLGCMVFSLEKCKISFLSLERILISNTFVKKIDNKSWYITRFDF